MLENPLEHYFPSMTSYAWFPQPTSPYPQGTEQGQLYESLGSGEVKPLEAWVDGYVLIENPDGTITATTKFSGGIPPLTLRKVATMPPSVILKGEDDEATEHWIHEKTYKKDSGTNCATIQGIRVGFDAPADELVELGNNLIIRMAAGDSEGWFTTNNYMDNGKAHTIEYTLIVRGDVGTRKLIDKAVLAAASKEDEKITKSNWTSKPYGEALILLDQPGRYELRITENGSGNCVKPKYTITKKFTVKKKEVETYDNGDTDYEYDPTSSDIDPYGGADAEAGIPTGMWITVGIIALLGVGGLMMMSDSNTTAPTAE